ncbi:McrB family protein [Neobacillus bataviensis]|uniref:McrB family protein n=1 Tax=Neobacillus bataviensis TaxID=220685 RepID=UPI001CBD5C3D|nr:hypothetical protein [Neobacillus bataviensis]
MPYSYPFTHNLRDETTFKNNLRNFSGEIVRANGDETQNKNFLDRHTKTERNVITELTSYMHLKNVDLTPTNIAREIVLGNEEAVLYNAIKKFQYPNLCARNGFSALESGIEMVPMRTMLKLLFLRYMDDPTIDHIVTLNEISLFFFSNPDVYSAGSNVDCIQVWAEILEYRKNGTVPPKIDSDIHIEERELRDMFKFMSYSGLVHYERSDGSEYICLAAPINDVRRRMIEEICFDNSFFEIVDRTRTTLEQYIAYMDMPSPVQVHTPNLNLNHIIHWFTDNPSEVYSEDLIANFHINLNCLEDKHFVILSGISGTGKTNLIKQYANAVYNLNTTDDNPYFHLISVKPDWEDEKPLFGYYNALQNRYEVPKFLEVLLLAAQYPNQKFFVCLDEMNLAHVEYYFADFLSAVEAKEPINLNGHPISELEIPNNLYIVGTINEDETTERISDKVWDRAFKMEMSKVNIKGFIENYCDKNDINAQIVDDLEILNNLNNVLKEVDMHFGYRIAKEAIEKLNYNYTHLDTYFTSDFLTDSLIIEKIVPKLKIEMLSQEITESLLSVIDQNRFPKTHQKILSLKEIIESDDTWGL